MQYLYESELSIERTAPRVSAFRGNLPVIEYLWARDGAHAEPRCDWDSEVPNAAAREGHLHVVKWISEHTPLRCTVSSFPTAAGAGNVEQMQYLLDHCDAPIDATMIQEMLDEAADCNHLELMRFLQARGGDMVTERAMDGAATYGNMEFLQFLHTPSSRGCSSRAMDGAARNGHLEILQFLHEHRREGCTRQALDDAAMRGRLDVVKFLHETVGLEIDKDLVVTALYSHNLEIIKYFHSLGVIEEKRVYAKRCIHLGELSMLKYLCSHELTSVKVKHLMENSFNGPHSELCELVAYVLQHDCSNMDMFEFDYWLLRVVAKMAERGRLRLIQFLDAQCGVPLVNCTFVLEAAARDGRLDMLQHFCARAYRAHTAAVRESALQSGHTCCVELLREGCGLVVPRWPVVSRKSVEVDRNRDYAGP